MSGSSMQPKPCWTRVTLLLLATLCAGPAAQAQTANADVPLEIRGALDVLIVEDIQRGQAATHYFVREPGKRRGYEVKFKAKPSAQLRTGQRVTVKGKAKGDQLEVEALTVTGDGAPSAPASKAAMQGERRAVVLRVNLRDAVAPYTAEQLADTLYTGARSVDKLYRDVSRGQLYFAPDADSNGAPDIFGPYAIDYSAAQSCDYYSWAFAAEEAATRAGVDLSRYQHRIFVLPHYDNLPQCGWAGVANVGCGESLCRVWITDAASPLVLAHELGHNLGMNHAGVDPDNDGLIDNFYGDYSDPMGGWPVNWRRFNAPHVDQMGWFPASIVTITASGVYDIAALGADPGAIHAPLLLKVAKPDSQEYYYFSYRRNEGYDASLEGVYTQGVNIHRYRGYGDTAWIGSLTDAATFSDNVNGVSVTQVSHSSEYVTVDIGLCSAVEPTVSLTPAVQAVRPGGRADYTATVHNRDSAECAQTGFSLNYQGPGDKTLIPDTLTLGSGQQHTAALRVNTSGIADGAYAVQLQLVDADGVAPSHSAGVSDAALVVDGVAPPAPAGLRGASLGEGRIQLDWDAAADSGSGVQAYIVQRNGVVLGETSALSYTDLGAAMSATHRYAVFARDAAGNVSAASASVDVFNPLQEQIPQCTEATPTVSLTPAVQAAPPGAVVNYAVEVGNQDNEACRETTFTLRYTGALGGVLTPETLRLGSGRSGAATLQLGAAPPADLPPEGRYTLTVEADDNDGAAPNHTNAGAGAALLIVDGAAPSPPTGLRGAPDVQGRIGLSWNAAVDALAGVRLYRLYRDDAALAETTALNYTDTATTPGVAYRYAIAAVDWAGNASPPSAEVNVFSGCETARPTLSLTPPSQIAQPGDTVSYQLALTNQNSSGCAPTQFTLTYQGVPRAEITPSSAPLASGRSAVATLQVEARSQTDSPLADGDYALAARASDNNDQAPDRADPGVTSATLVIDGAPPTVPTGLQAVTDSGGAIRLRWNAAADAVAGVAEYVLFRDGAPLVRVSALEYVDGDVAMGRVYRYAVAAVDKVGNVSSPAGPAAVISGCLAAPPALTLTPVSVAAQPGVAAGYRLQLDNRDTAACPATTFTLSYSGAPAVTLTPDRVTLNAGQSSVALLQAQAAVTGAFAIEAQVADSDGGLPHHTVVKGNVTLVVDNTAPTIPQGLQGAADAQGRIDLSWQAAADDLSGVDRYVLYRDGALLGETPELSYADATATPGLTYKYAIAARDRAGNISSRSPAIDVLNGCSARNPTVTLTPASQAVKPNVEALYTVTVANQDSTACATATKFTLSYTGGAGGALADNTLTLAAGQSGQTTLKLKVGASNAYTPTVKVEDKDGVAPNHAAVTVKGVLIVDGVAPTVPTGLQATTDAQGVIQLNWSASSDPLSGVSGYNVYRLGVLLAQTAEPRYTDAAAKPGVRYRYFVTARDNLGNMSVGSTVVELVSACLIGAPTVALTPTSAMVLPGAVVSYDVKVTNGDSSPYCPATGFTLSYAGTPAATLTATQLTVGAAQQGAVKLQVDTTGLSSKSYNLQVQIADNDGLAPAHAAVTGGAAVVVDGDPPTKPDNLQASTDASGWVTLTWRASTDSQSGLQGYTVYRDGAWLGDTTSAGYVDKMVTVSAVYRYTVIAKDMLGNQSSLSNAVDIAAGCLGSAAPTVLLNPSSQAAPPNTAVSYDVTVRNEDYLACPATAFTLSYRGSPSGVLASTTLTLAAGQSKTVALQLTTAGLSSQSYSLEAQAADNDRAAPDHTTGKGRATLILDGAPPTAPTGLQAVTDIEGVVQLNWDAAIDSLSGVQYYAVQRDGVPQILQTYGLGYVDFTAVPGVAYRYEIVAVDGAGNVATAAVELVSGCLTAAPTLSLTPASRIVRGGAVVDYELVVGNQDGRRHCPATAFTLSYSGPSTAVATPDLLVVSGGDSANAVLRLDTTGLADGSYNLQARAADGDGVAPHHPAVSAGAVITVDSTPPPIPADLQATTEADSRVSLNWRPVTDALAGLQKYLVYRNGAPLGETAAPLYLDDTPEPGVVHRYTVAAVDAVGNASAPSAPAQALLGCVAVDPAVTLTPVSQAVKPGAPATYTVTIVNQDSGTCPASGFTLSYSSGRDGPAGALTPAALTLPAGQSVTATLQVSNAAEGSFTLQVKAADSDGALPLHANVVTAAATLVVDGAAPTAPTDLQAPENAQGAVTLAWSAATDSRSGVQAYLVRRNSIVIGEVPAATLTYADAGVSPGATYFYTVAARDQAGNLSAYSTGITLINGCTAATPLVTLDPVSQLVKAGTAAGYTATVTNQDDGTCPATAFTLSYAGSPAGALTTSALNLGPGQSGTTTLQVTTTSTGSYTIQAKAADNDGKPPPHMITAGGATFISDGSKPSTPAGLQATAGPGRIALQWTASTDTYAGVQAYIVYRNASAIAETTETRYTDVTVAAGTVYEYKIAARDKVGNVSGLSGGKKLTAQ